jgi:hypothetical protein
MNPHSEIFEFARQLPEGERTAYLDEACPDPAEREKIESMLKEADEADAFLKTLPAENYILPQAPAQERPGDHIGSYKLREMIGDGNEWTDPKQKKFLDLPRLVADPPAMRKPRSFQLGDAGSAHCYHVVSRVAGREILFGDEEREAFAGILRKQSTPFLPASDPFNGALKRPTQKANS